MDHVSYEDLFVNLPRWLFMLPTSVVIVILLPYCTFDILKHMTRWVKRLEGGMLLA